jgi:hypothetical protein
MILDENALLDRLNELKRDSWLESRLVQWAREYGHGKADDLGYAHVNALQRLHDHAGWLPPPLPVRAPIRTEADKTELAVATFEKTEWAKAQVLRIDYYRPNISIDMRLERLGKVGVRISKRGYYYHLGDAKDFVRNILWEMRKSA